MKTYNIDGLLKKGKVPKNNNPDWIINVSKDRATTNGLKAHSHAELMLLNEKEETVAGVILNILARWIILGNNKLLPGDIVIIGEIKHTAKETPDGFLRLSWPGDP